MAQPVILLVDDQHREILDAQLMLQDAGFTTILWSTDDNPMQVIMANRPDLVVIDIRLDEHPVGGWRLVKQMRADPRFSHIPIILTTDEKPSPDAADEDDPPATLSRGTAAGEPGRAFLTIRKPYDSEILLTAIRELLDIPPPSAR